MKRLLVLFVLFIAASGISCSTSIHSYPPSYYEARGVPVREIAPGVRAYYIDNDWAVYDYRDGRWHPYTGRVVVRGSPVIR